jgi:hypothetical protein
VYTVLGLEAKMEIPVDSLHSNPHPGSPTPLVFRAEINRGSVPRDASEVFVSPFSVREPQHSFVVAQARRHVCHGKDGRGALEACPDVVGHETLEARNILPRAIRAPFPCVHHLELLMET